MMDQELILTGLALVVFYFLWKRTQRLHIPKDASPELRALLIWNNLRESEKTISAAEAFLEQNPEDLARRIGILSELGSGEHRDPAKLRLHTLELIKRLPNAVDVQTANESEFFRNPAYRDEVIEALTAQLGKDLHDAEIHRSLGWILGRAAIPVEEATTFREWNGLEPDTPLPAKLDAKVLDRAVEHYRTAMELSSERFDKAAHAQSLASLLSDAGRFEEAIPAFRIAVELSAEQDQDCTELLVDFGKCLIKVGELSEAKEKLALALKHDTEGLEGGPGCGTTEAETILGHVAFQAKDYKTAANHLIRSTEVQQYSHSTTRGFPTYLAEELIAHEPQAVADFCETVLKEFTPGDSDIEELRTTATAKLKA